MMLTVMITPARADDDPQPGSPEWTARDAENMAWAHGRLVDEYGNPAFHSAYWTETVPITVANVQDQASHPDRPVLTVSRLLPGETADPFRVGWDRGRVADIGYLNRYGARITGHVWAPKADGSYPGIVITTGSIQGFEELYWWAAQGLAEAGYVVMTYDVQGQGESETFGHRPDGSLWCDLGGECPGVPSQQATNFTEGTTDALEWFLSTANPFRSLIDEDHLGLAGHSLGASAVTEIGNIDPRIDAVVGWDNVSLPASIEPRVPTLGLNADYFFNVTPTTSAPDPNARNATFRRFKDAGVPAMQVALRGSTHLEFTFVPYILPASSKGERVAMHYTLAWFDRWLRGAADPAAAADARARLSTTTFDASADASAIGSGTYDATSRSNVPRTIAGDAVSEHLSIYYRSSYAFDGLACADMRAGC